MIKRILLLQIFCLLCVDLYGQRRGDRERGRGIFEKSYNPDADYDFKVDTVELRDWVSNVSAIYSSGREFFRENEGVKLVREFDKDKDRKISTKESLEFRNYIKPIFEKAAKKLLLENDLNKNRRLDKSEIESLREKVPSFLNYALKNDASDKQEAVRQEVRKVTAEEKEKSRPIDDIYD